MDEHCMDILTQYTVFLHILCEEVIRVYVYNVNNAFE